MPVVVTVMVHGEMSVLPRITGIRVDEERVGGNGGLEQAGPPDAELRSTLYPLELLHTPHPHKYDAAGIVPGTLRQPVEAHPSKRRPLSDLTRAQ